MSLTALTKELNTLKDKEKWLEVSALRLAAMKVFVKHHEKNKTSANKKANKIWEHALSEQRAKEK